MEYTIPFKIPDLECFKVCWDQIDCDYHRIEIPIEGECGVSTKLCEGWDDEPRQLLYTKIFCPEFNRYLPTTIKQFEGHFKVYNVTEEYEENDITYPYYCWHCVRYNDMEQVIKEYGYETKTIYGYIIIHTWPETFESFTVNKEEHIINVTISDKV